MLSLTEVAMAKFSLGKGMFFIIKDQRSLQEGTRINSSEVSKTTSYTRMVNNFKTTISAPKDFTLYYCHYNSCGLIKAQTVCLVKDGKILSENIVEVFDVEFIRTMIPSPEVMADCCDAIAKFEKDYVVCDIPVVVKLPKSVQDPEQGFVNLSESLESLSMAKLVEGFKSGKNISP